MQATRICTTPGCPDPRMVCWSPLVGYEGVYEVHSHGDVRRVGRAARNGNGRGGGARIGLILKPHEIRGRYQVVQLWSNGKPRMRLVHILVAAAFIGPCPEGKEVNHKDGDKHNNCAGNLEYVTHAENQLHAYRTGLRLPTPNPRRKPRVMILCACGCGTQIETPNKRGADVRFVSTHNSKRRIAR